MSHKYTVPLKKLIRDLDLKIVYYPQTDEEILVSQFFSVVWIDIAEVVPA